MNNKKKLKKPLALLLTICAVLSLLCSGASAVLPTKPEKQSAEDCFLAASKSVLYIRAYNETGRLITTGSGYLITKDGCAVTAAHVIRKAEKITATLSDGKEVAAEKLFFDADTDVAVLRLPQGSYAFLSVTDKTPKSGAVLRALGYPLKDSVLITEGICSSPSATVSGKTGMLMTCQVAGGMSGGPILNEYGQVAGVVSGSVLTMQGINLSVRTEALWSAVKPYLPT